MIATVQVTLQYFPGCPNWQACRDVVLQALRLLYQPEDALALQEVSTAEEAEAARFRGSPTVLFDGIDPFAEPSAAVGLSCRVFPTPAGPAGAPTLDQVLVGAASRVPVLEGPAERPEGVGLLAQCPLPRGG